MHTPHPYKQRVIREGVILREFRGDVNQDELVWHQDLRTRRVRVVEGSGWKLQLESGLPFPLKEGSTYEIPARTWHRIIRGSGSLRILIREVLESDFVGEAELDEVGYKNLTQAQAKKRYDNLKKKYPKWKDRLRAFSWASDPEAALGGLRAKAKGY